VATIFRHAERMAVAEPGQLIGQLLAFGERNVERQRESVLEEPCYDTLDPPDLVDVADDLFTNGASHRRDQGDAAGRHVDCLAWELLPVGQHVSAQHRDPHTLVTAAFDGVRFG